jgi:hypothetical protein
MAKSFVKLTRANQRSLRAGGTIAEHGIIFERLPNKDGVYSVNVMVDGQRIHRVVGRESDGTTRTQAEEFIAKVRHDAKNDRLSLPKGRKLALSFREASAKYLDVLQQEGGHSIPKKRQQLEQHLVPFFGTQPLAKLTSSDVERYKKLRCGQPAVKSNARGKGPTFKHNGASPGTVNRELVSRVINS